MHPQDSEDQGLKGRACSMSSWPRKQFPQSCVAKALDSSILILLLEIQVLKMNLFSFIDQKVHQCTTHVEVFLLKVCETLTWKSYFFLGLSLHHSYAKWHRDQSLRLLSSLFWTTVMNCAMSERSTLSIFTSCNEMRSQRPRCGFGMNQQAFSLRQLVWIQNRMNSAWNILIVAILQYLPDLWLTLSFFIAQTAMMAPLILLLTDFDIQSLQVVDQLHENLPWHGFATATFCLIPISCQGYFTDFTDLRSSNRRGSPMRTLSRALATQSGRNSQTKALEVQISLPKTYDPVTPWKSQVSWPSRTEAATGSSIPSAKKWRT